MKFGILGTGKIVQAVFPHLCSHGFSNIYFLSTERSREQAEKMVTGCPGARVFTDYDRLLASDIEAVYIALPNSLHFSFAKKALEVGKHVLVEKPAVPESAQWSELCSIAKQNHLILLEGMCLHYLPAFQKIRELLPEIGPVRMANFTFCQYSSRYEAFQKGKVAPAFDPGFDGGALRDLNVYNLHALVGLFGAPESCSYLPNLQPVPHRESLMVDTGGILTLRYPGFPASAIASKDCGAACHSFIAGERGSIEIPETMNKPDRLLLELRGKEPREYDFREGGRYRLLYEFEAFEKMIRCRDAAAAEKQNEISLQVITLLEHLHPYEL